MINNSENNLKENEEVQIDDDSNEELDEEEFIKEITDKVYIDDDVKFKYSPLKHCPLDQIFANLMEISNKCIKKGGYMVCLYPVNKKKEEAE